MVRHVETPDEYLERKRVKGVLGQPKPDKWQGRTVFTGFCPCPDCGHEGQSMMVCDPDYNDCKCCNEVCS